MTVKAVRYLAPSGAGPHSQRTHPYECFVPRLRERKVYILKDSGLKVLRMANAFMAMNVIGEYQEVILGPEAFAALKRVIETTKRAH